MTQERVGLYPGTFDPITLGHCEIMTRAAKLMDRLIIGVAKNPGKNPLFDTKTRVKLVQQTMAPLIEAGAKIDVLPFDTLLMHFAKAQGANIILRGLRAVSDFEYEFQMAGMNQRLSSEIETVFLMASDRHQFIASRFVKEIAALGGDIRPFVTPFVADAIEKRVAQESTRKKLAPEVRD